MSEVHPLKAWRDRQLPPLTLEDAAAQLGVTKSAISRWETGDRKLDEALLPTVAERTGIPAAELRPDLAELFQASTTKETVPATGVN